MGRTGQIGSTLLAACCMAGCFGAKSDTTGSSAGTTVGTNAGTTAHTTGTSATSTGTHGSTSAGTTSTTASSTASGVTGSASTTTSSTATTNAGTTGFTSSTASTGLNTSTGTTGITSVGTTGLNTSTGTTSFTTSTGTTSFTTSTGTTSFTTSTGTTGTSSVTTSTGTTGTTAHTTSTSSTGTTGHSTSSTTGTVGSSTGTTGGTNDCRSNGCGYGENCQAYPSSSGTVWLCVCSFAGGQSGTDSCSGNPDGNTVCDSNSYQCTKPTDYGACNPTQGSGQCAAGYTCVQYSGPTDGYCLQTCNQTSDCNLTYAQCLSGGGATRYCQVDTCGPTNFGAQNGNYYGPCDLADAGDGYCEPFADGQGGVVGYCMASGPTPTGGFCPGFGVDASEQCTAGDICYSFGLRFHDGGAADQCFIACDASQAGNSCPGGSACYPNDPSSNTSPDPGICFP